MTAGNPRPFNDHASEFFGRHQTVKDLVDRAAFPGLTAVAGPPHIGKSWLLEHTAARLSRGDEYLVGRVIVTPDMDDVLLRAVADLYARWLSDASLLDQAKLLFNQHKSDLLASLGSSVCEFLSTILALKTGGLNRIVQHLTKLQTVLPTVQKTLTTGGLSLPLLPSTQACALLQAVHKLSQRKVVLILDALDQSPMAERDAARLSTFPEQSTPVPCHIFVGVRTGSPPLAVLDRATTEKPDCTRTDVDPLSPLTADEAKRLYRHLRELSPVFSEVDDAVLESMISGMPSVLERWRWAGSRDRLQSVADLRACAEEGRNATYSELEHDLLPKILNDVDPDLLNLSVKLALLPEIPSNESWEEISVLALQDGDERRLDKLQRIGLLDATVIYPSFGHTTRHEAFCDLVLRSKRLPKNTVHREIELLVVACGLKRQEILCLPADLQPPVHRRYGLIVARLYGLACHLNMARTFRAVCFPLSFLTPHIAPGAPGGELRNFAHNAVYAAKKYPDLRIAISLFLANEHNNARKAALRHPSLVMKDGETPFHRRFFSQMEAIAQRFRTDVEVQRRWARTLGNAVNPWCTKAEIEQIRQAVRTLRNRFADDAELMTSCSLVELNLRGGRPE